MKKILTIEEQLEHLENNKNIIFKNQQEKERGKKFFERYNYLNIISLKYLFASGKNQRKDKNGKVVFEHEYRYSTKYKDIEKKYKELLKFENKIRENILCYETELKVHLVMFLKEFLEKENISFKDLFDELYEYNKSNKNFFNVNNNIIFMNKLEKEWESHVKNYSSNHGNWHEYYYLFIKILSFGTLNRVLGLSYFYKPTSKYESLYSLFHKYLNRGHQFFIGNSLDDLVTIGILRNALCHKESLVIFLEKGYRKNKIIAKKLKGKGIMNNDFLQERIISIEIIYNYYLKIQNKKKKQLDSKSWIKNFSKYRLKNGKEMMFNKQKINL